MSLKDQLIEDMKQAMRARDAFKLGVIRFVLADIKNLEIDKGPQDDESTLKLIQSQVKKMKEAIIDFARGKRDDLVEEEEKKIAILQTYLPQQMSEEDLMNVVKDVVNKSSSREIGPLTGMVLKEVKGKADGNRVGAAIRQHLGQ